MLKWIRVGGGFIKRTTPIFQRRNIYMIQVKRKKREITIGPWSIGIGRTEIHTNNKKKVTKTKEVKKHK